MNNLHAHEQEASTAELVAPPQRGRFEGVLNVVRFNWPLYVVGLTVVIAALLAAALISLPLWMQWILFVASASAIYLLAASLIVSYWIYDRSSLYRFDWAKDSAGAEPSIVINLHSGFDESSTALRNIFPTANLQIFYFYDPARMTEASIARARRYQNDHVPKWLESLTMSVSPDSLPAGDSSVDAIFVILAIHEVRHPQDRQKLFSQFHRTLRPGGRLILLEHLRNLPNFLVFGPQFVHFYSRRTWLDLARGAGLMLIHESRNTPFIGHFIFEKPPLNHHV